MNAENTKNIVRTRIAKTKGAKIELKMKDEERNGYIYIYTYVYIYIQVARMPRLIKQEVAMRGAGGRRRWQVRGARWWGERWMRGMGV